MPGTLFCIAGLIVAITSLVTGQIIPHIQIAMMFVCIGLMLGNRNKRN